MPVYGINKAGVPAIQKAIKDYQREINRSKEMMKDRLINISSSGLMKGENTVSTMRKYVSQLSDETEFEIIAYLTSITNEINEVYAGYVKNDKAAAAFSSRIKKS